MATLVVRLAGRFGASPADPGQASVPLLFDHTAEQFCAARSFTEAILNNGMAVGALVCVGSGSSVCVAVLVGAMTALI